jgi:hypothetical protein
MIFVSYSQKDQVWLERFITASKPLDRYAQIDLWSDRRIKPGDDWQREIDSAMDRAVIAVLLVSMNFLDSDFIYNVELPYILAAAKKRNLKILLVRLTPCYLEATPLHKINAAAGYPKPLNAMAEYGWMEELCKVCGEIDKIVKKFETPNVNSALSGRDVQIKEPKLKVLAKPASRETEILVYAPNGYWYTQSRILKGSMNADCHFGNSETKAGTVFKIIALTRGVEGRLGAGTKFPSLPAHRTKSQEVTVRRR